MGDCLFSSFLASTSRLRSRWLGVFNVSSGLGESLILDSFALTSINLLVDGIAIETMGGTRAGCLAAKRDRFETGKISSSKSSLMSAALMSFSSKWTLRFSHAPLAEVFLLVLKFFFVFVGAESKTIFFLSSSSPKIPKIDSPWSSSFIYIE